MSLVSDPTYPIVGETVTLSITSATGDTAATRFYLGVKPDRSVLAVGPLVNDEGEYVQTFVPDVQGAYTFVAYDYRRRTVGEVRDDLVGQQSDTVYVGALAELPIETFRGDGATLQLRIVNATVRAAKLVNPLTEVSRYAVKASTVTSRLNTLVGVAVSALNPDFATDVNAIVAAFELHTKLAPAVHNVADTVSDVTVKSAYSTESAIVRLYALQDQLLYHMRGERDGRLWHNNDDEKNVPVTKPGTSLSSAVVLKADLRERVYERHRVQTATPAVHNGADNSNMLTDPGPLDDLIAVFLDELVNTAPTAAQGEQEGTTDIGRTLGFKVL